MIKIHQSELLRSALGLRLATGARMRSSSPTRISRCHGGDDGQTAMETCKANGYTCPPTSIGAIGEVIVAMRGDDTGPHTWRTPCKKALHRRGQRRPSGEFAENVARQLTAGALRLSNIIAGAGRAADQGRRGHDRRHRRVRRAGRRQG